MSAHLYKLVNSTHTSKNSIITNSYMTCNLCVITQNAMVANNTIMRKVAISHYQAIVANNGLLPVHCATIDSNKLADCCVITYNHTAVFTLKFQILRNGGNNCTGKNSAIFSNAGSFHNGYIRTDPGTLTNLNILVNSRKRIYFD